MAKIQKHKTNNNQNNNEKSKPNTIICEAQVVEVLPNTKFKVLLKDFDTIIDASPSGKIRLNHIKILKGDMVRIEMSTYDLTKGRIVFRHKNNFTPSNDNDVNLGG